MTLLHRRKLPRGLSGARHFAQGHVWGILTLALLTALAPRIAKAQAQTPAQPPLRVESPAGQAPTRLHLSQLLAAAATSYPTMQAARLEARASAEDITVAERQRWPTISTTVESYSGNLRSVPSRGVQIDQTLWDGGRNSARIAESRLIAHIGLYKIYAQQQDLFLQITASWQNALNAREHFEVAERTLQRLEEFKEQMRRRVAAEASPRIDLELADARILQTQVEQTAALSSLRIQLMRLEQFSGLSDLQTLGMQALVPPSDADLRNFAEHLGHMNLQDEASQHPAVAKAREEVELTRRRLDGKRAENWPQVYLRVYQPIGTIASSDDTSMSTFIGMRYSPGAGFASFAETKAMATRITGAEQGVDGALREIEQALRGDREEFESAQVRIEANQQAVDGADRVLKSYQRQFQAGRKSWQDLLNAARELAQTQYALADAHSALQGAMYRMQIRLGIDISSTGAPL